ncbi:MAG: hypothetical protein U0516_04390 [Candidatus Saccharibacteria bacterium]
MRNYLPKGDTLIEVIFAFAILGTIIGFAFTGVIQGRRSAMSAQQRTQALFLLQQQSEALVGYRSSLVWSSADGCPSFLEGGTGSLGCSSSLPIITTTHEYCLKIVNGAQTTWSLIDATTNPNQCTASETGITVKTKFSGRNPLSTGDLNLSNVTSASTEVQADVVATWSDSYGTQSAQNIVILTKNR